MEQKKGPNIIVDWRTVTEILSVLILTSTDLSNHGPYKVDDPPPELGDALHPKLQRAVAVALVRQLLAEHAEEKQWSLDCRIDVTIAMIYGPYPDWLEPLDCENLLR